MKVLQIWLLSAIFLLIQGLILQAQDINPEPTRIIWDTDMQWDWDDAGALAILHALADEGDAEILGIGSSVRGQAGEWNPHTIDIINTYYRRPDIPIGKSLSGPGLNDVYGKWIVDQGLVEYELAPGQVWDNVVKLYRKLLSEQPDTSVVLVSVGYTSNIRDLLMSEPDEYSDLNGRDLIAQKVNFWSCMAGKYPGSGSEANMQDWHGHTKYAFDNFPRPILGTSSEAGNVSGAGSSLEFTPVTNPVRAIYRKRLDDRGYPHTFSHASWDPIATLVAARDASQYFDLTESGSNVITINADNSQSNQWQSEPDHGFSYLIQTDPNHVSEVLDELVGRAPALPNQNPRLFLEVSGNGTIDLVGGTVGSGDSVISLTAKGGLCYEFSHWSGDLTGDKNPVVINLEDNKNIVAVFSRVEGCVIPDLIAHWPLTEASGGVAEDISGNHFDLELVSTGDAGWEEDVVRGRSLKLNGRDEYGEVSPVATRAFQLGTFSITSLVKLETGMLASWSRVAGISNAYGFNINEEGKLGMWTNNGIFWYGSYGDHRSLSDGRWHHIAVTHDDERGNVLYMDGENVLVQNWSEEYGNAIVYPVEEKLFKVGTDDGSNHLSAHLQDIRMYNRVLNQSEVAEIMSELNFTDVGVITKPGTFQLRNYPNPFSHAITITYTLSKNSYVNLVVKDIYGRDLVVLVRQTQQAGTYRLEWDGSGLSAGVYFISMNHNLQYEVNRVVKNG